MYVKRDADDRIVQVRTEAGDDCREYLASGDAELLAFVGAAAPPHGGHRLMRDSDLEFVRVLEDVVGVLIDKNLIRFTDLPNNAQRKLSERHFMRNHINSVGLWDEPAAGSGMDGCR